MLYMMAPYQTKTPDQQRRPVQQNSKQKHIHMRSARNRPIDIQSSLAPIECTPHPDSTQYALTRGACFYYKCTERYNLLCTTRG